MAPRILQLRRVQTPIRLLGAAALAVATLGLSGCQSLVGDGLETAQIRFVDASAEAPGMDLYLNGSGAAYGLSFGTVTSYIPVTPGESRIAANRANTTQAMVSAHVALGSTREYTAVVSNSLSSMETKIYPDAGTPAPAGMISVRVLNEAADTGPLDVYVFQAGEPREALVRGLPYAGDGGYVNLPAGISYRIAVVPAGTGGSTGATGVLRGISVEGSSGSVRTLVLSDGFTAAGRALTGFVLEDFDAS